MEDIDQEQNGDQEHDPDHERTTPKRLRSVKIYY